MTKRDGWGESRRIWPITPGADRPSKLALFAVGMAGIGAALTVSCWLILGDIADFDGPIAGQLMIAAGLILGGMAGLTLPFLLSRRAAGDSQLTQWVRMLSVVLVLVAISPAIYIALVVGTAFNEGNN